MSERTHESVQYLKQSLWLTKITIGTTCQAYFKNYDFVSCRILRFLAGEKNTGWCHFIVTTMSLCHKKREGIERQHKRQRKAKTEKKHLVSMACLSGFTDRHHIQCDCISVCKSFLFFFVFSSFVCIHIVYEAKTWSSTLHKVASSLKSHSGRKAADLRNGRMNKR